MPHGRGIRAGLGIALAAALAAAAAAQEAKISVLFSSRFEPHLQAMEGFKRHLHSQGVAAKISMHDLSGGGPEEWAAALAQEQPRLIFALGTQALKLAQEKSRGVPIVFSMLLAPPAEGSGRITGVTLRIPPETRLAAIRRALPLARKIGLVYSRDLAGEVEMIEAAADRHGFNILKREVAADRELPEALDEFRKKIDLFLMLPDPKVYFPKSVEYLLLEGLKREIPVIGLSSSYTKAGALLSLDCDYEEIGRQCAEQAGRILSGADPASIPVANPKKVKWSINLLTAERLGVWIPEEFQQGAAALYGNEQSR